MAQHVSLTEHYIFQPNLVCAIIKHFLEVKEEHPEDKKKTLP